MALFWAYVPEPDEMEALLRAGGTATGQELERREDRLLVGYLELQAYCNRNPGKRRYLTRAETMEILVEDWVLAALCTQLPGRPPLLHAPGGPGTMCRFDGCLDECLDEACTCSVGAWRPDTDFRLCLAI